MRRSLGVFAAAAGLLFSAQAKNVYVACDWSSFAGTVPASQEIRLCDGTTLLKSVTVTAAAGWKVCVPVSCDGTPTVTPVYPSGGCASCQQRDYGCKTVSGLDPTRDRVMVDGENGPFVGWSDLQDSRTVVGWNGAQTKGSTLNAAALYCNSSDADPIYDVRNYPISYSVSGCTNAYDETGHSIDLKVYTSGCSTEYSADGVSWSGTNPSHVEIGSYTTHFRVLKDGQTPVSGSAAVVITNGIICASAKGCEEWYDGNRKRSIEVTVTSPQAGYSVEYSLTGADGSWFSAKPTYTDVGTYTNYYRVSKAKYGTKTGFAVVKIKALQDLAYASSDYLGTYDGNWHGISVSVTTPSSGASVYYATSSNGNYSSSVWYNNRYCNAGTNVVWYKIAATGYRQAIGSNKVIIKPKSIVDNQTIQGYTNAVYNGGYPWGNTGWYTVDYGPWGWGHGWGWVIFRGKGNYTGVWSNRYYIARQEVKITSGSAFREYNGAPLTCDSVTSTGFIDGEGLDPEKTSAYGSQTEVGVAPNVFTYGFLKGTDPDNYDITVVTGRLTVTAITPPSLRYPAKIEIVGTNVLTVGVRETYRYRITYSDGSTSTSGVSPEPDWSLAPGWPQVKMGNSGHSRELTAHLAGAGATNVLAVCWTNTYDRAASVTNGLVAWYPLDGDTEDKSIHNRALTHRYGGYWTGYYAPWTEDRTAQANRALCFQGTSSSYDYVTDSSAIALASNALSITAWIKPEAYDRLGLLYRSGQLSLKFRQNGDWLFNGETIAANAAVATGAWQHVALTWDGKTLCTYLNGSKTCSEAFSSAPLTGEGSLYAGLAVDGLGTEYFQGAVDDLRIFSRALSASEISSIKAGIDVIRADSAIGVGTSREIAVDPHTRIPVAVDVEEPEGAAISDPAISFTTGATDGGAGWFGQFATYCGSVTKADDFDLDAAQSGSIPDGGTSWLKTTSLSTAGNLSFWWKTDCEATYDCLVFKTNGVEVARTSGTNGWKRMSFDLPCRHHVLCWEYAKDGKNGVGADAAWLDRIVWTPLDVPNHGGISSHVEASDGLYDDYVYVQWGVPSSVTPILGYRVWRKVSGANDNTYEPVSDELTARDFADLTAEPGVEYVYQVRARNAQGWGVCGRDNGWRNVVLAIDPKEHHFSNVPAGEFVRVNVQSNALWKILSKSSWLNATLTNGGFVVTAENNDDSKVREGTVTVTCGLDGSGREVTKRARVELDVTQSASIDIGFGYPYDDWRTRLQITSTNDVAGYAPESVFPADAARESLRISFGWRNDSDVAVTLPAVRFRVIRPDLSVALSWLDDGSGITSGSTRELAARSRTVCGFWNADHLRMLQPGDYELEAELDPENVLEDPKKADNTAVFRFAIRDTALAIGEAVFSDGCWTNLVVSNGNDFAQAPHAATRDAAPVVQFGPYVPMDGVNGRLVEKKKPVDIVLLIDYSGSMDACIAGLMNNVGQFVDRLLIGDPERGVSPIEDLRIKIVGFSDYGRYGQESEGDWSYKNWMREYSFTTDRKLLKRQLDELRQQCYGGCGNGGESSYDALYYICREWSTVWDGTNRPSAHVATSSPFRDIDKVARAVVLFTDEPPNVPLAAPDCPHEENLDGLDAALKAAKINLTIIGDGNYYREYAAYDANVHWLADLKNLASADSKRDMKETYPISNFTQDTSKLQELAELVVLQVPTVATVVEPSFSAAVRGEGDLTFRWINDSTALGTNNTFTFQSEGVTNLVRYGALEPVWREEKVSFAFDGLHPFKWMYRKLGYEGAVADCGLVADALWTPRATHLEIDPHLAEVDFLGTNQTQVVTQIVGCVAVPSKAYGATYGVTCNAKWRVIDHSDWINLVQDNGEGDGKLVITVATNTALEARTGFVTVRAGEDGTAAGTDEETVYVRQSEFVPPQTADPQILTVAVKPRWPWNDTVDIDFRVLLPTDNAPLKVWFRGVNKEGGALAEQFPLLSGEKRYFTPTPANVCTNESIASGGCGFCPTSGWYRITWKSTGEDLVTAEFPGYAKKEPWGPDSFHSPAFGVELSAQRYDGTGVCAVRDSPTVRLDARQTNAGGYVMTGTEMVGHPTGGYPGDPVDPIAVDTTNLVNGMNCLDPFIVRPPEGQAGTPYGYSPSNRTHACVINRENVAIEGGNITNDTVWGADKIHLVRDNVFVQPGATLTIAHGAVVKFCYWTRIFIYKDPGVTAVCGDQFNIRVAGAYMGGATWKGYENDEDETLYGMSANDGRGSAGDGIMDYCFYSQSWTDEFFVPGNYNTKYSKRGECLQSLRLTAWEDGGNKFTPLPWRSLYYSLDQPCGILPEPDCTDSPFTGLRFFGWYDGNYLSTTSSVYRKYGDYRIEPDSVLHSYAKTKPQIFAWMERADDPAWKDVEPIVDRRDASSGTITLKTPSVVYDGKSHNEDVVVDSFLLGGTPMETAYYRKDDGTNDYLNAGNYDVTVKFTAGYENSPTGTFTVLRRPVDGGEILLSTNSALYCPAVDGGVALPSVAKVMLPMGEDGAMVEIPERDRAEVYVMTNWFDLVQDETRYWPRPGTYHVELSFNGNYVGTLTNSFEILHNPEYDFTSARYATTTAEVAVARAKAASKRVLYVAGEVPDDAATAYVKSWIADDVDTNEWVIANFVCWTDSAASATFAKYAEGLGVVECPLVCVFNPDDLETPIVRLAGCPDKTTLCEFLAASLTAPVDAAAAEIAFRPGKGTFVYNDEVQVPTNTDLRITYAGTELPSDSYELCYSNPTSEDAGAYAVRARFKPGTWVDSYLVTGETAAVEYEIVPYAVSDGMDAAVRARLGVGLVPPVAAFSGEVQRPSVTSVEEIVSTNYYGAGSDWYNVGSHTVLLSFDGNYRGTISETYAITAKVVCATVELDRFEESVSSKGTDSLRPNVLKVCDASRTYTLGTDYAVDYGTGSYDSPGTNTITVSFCGNYSGTATVSFVIGGVEETGAPGIADDPGATVTGDAESGYVITPSVGRDEVVVTIPEGTPPSKVTVRLSPTVKVVNPQGADVYICREGRSYSVTNCLDFATEGDEIILSNATVKAEIVKEIFDPAAGAELDLNPDAPSLVTAPTKPGLLYTFSEGSEPDALDASATKIGDGTRWSPKVTVKGGSSGFYSITVEK